MNRFEVTYYKEKDFIRKFILRGFSLKHAYCQFSKACDDADYFDVLLDLKILTRKEMDEFLDSNGEVTYYHNEKSIDFDMYDITEYDIFLNFSGGACPKIHEFKMEAKFKYQYAESAYICSEEDLENSDIYSSTWQQVAKHLKIDVKDIENVELVEMKAPAKKAIVIKDCPVKANKKTAKKKK